MSLSQLSQLLPLPEEELQQVLDYALTLSKPDAASHFSNLLGDSPLAIDFISSFNSRRKPAAAIEPGPKSSGQAKNNNNNNNRKKGKAAMHTPQVRKVDDYAGPAGKAYNKKDAELEYIPQKAAASRTSTPTPTPRPEPVAAPRQNITTAGGYLISDVSKKGGKQKSAPASRSSTPKPAPRAGNGSGNGNGNGNVTKVSISGGVPMAGQSTALADLDHAIRSLEMTTNPSLDNPKARRCNCVAARHPLQAAAPNCLSCGKVVCMKQGLGPCTFCGAPILSSDDVQAMIRELKGERGREKMAANAKKPPAPFSQESGDAAARARQHRDKLLNFQANNAKRTTVHDEAADFDVAGAMSGTGGSMWATPEERARELKRQQKMVREMEWDARPEYEKRQQILSIDLSGRRVIKTIGSAPRPVTPDDEEEEGDEEDEEEVTAGRGGGGAFSSNPLLGPAVRPVWDAKGKGVEGEGRSPRRNRWRRVQDDLDDNEEVILDGGMAGHADEPECG